MDVFDRHGLLPALPTLAVKRSQQFDEAPRQTYSGLTQGRRMLGRLVGDHCARHAIHAAFCRRPALSARSASSSRRRRHAASRSDRSLCRLGSIGPDIFAVSQQDQRCDFIGLLRHFRYRARAALFYRRITAIVRPDTPAWRLGGPKFLLDRSLAHLLLSAQCPPSRGRSWPLQTP